MIGMMISTHCPHSKQASANSLSLGSWGAFLYEGWANVSMAPPDFSFFLAVSRFLTYFLFYSGG